MTDTLRQTLEQARDALSINRVFTQGKDGSYTREVTPKLITEAIASITAALAQMNEALRWKEPGELVLTFNSGALIKVELPSRTLYEIDISPRPYFQVCWAHGWGGQYDDEEEAKEDCLSLCGYGRSTREVKPGDDHYKNPYPPVLSEKRYPLFLDAHPARGTQTCCACSGTEYESIK